MIGFLITLGSLFAPIIVLIPVILEAKAGVKMPDWLNTPDDPVSPRGLYEPDQKAKLEKYGPVFAEWWWLGFRNSFYGLAYKYKPEIFKGITSYDGLRDTAKQWFEGTTRITEVGGYRETIYKFGPIGIITGYRVSSIFDSINKIPDEVVQHPNTAGRPCFSIRKYENCIG